MSQNKNQLATTTGTGVALKNASKSLRITNKLLAQVDDFEKDWQWWLGLKFEWKVYLLKHGLELKTIDYEWKRTTEVTGCIIRTIDTKFVIKKLEIDLLDKNVMRNLVERVVEISTLELPEDNKIDDISPIAYLKNLEVLELKSNNVQDLSPLRNLKNIKKLNLDWNSSISNFELLKNLKQLTYLSLEGNSIRNIDFLKDLTNLTYLNISNNHISDISVLSNLKELRTLGIYTNDIVDISALEKLDKLTEIILLMNKIKDISPLEKLICLEHLDLYNNEIENITPLVNLHKLEFLDIQGNNLSDNDVRWLKKKIPFCKISFSFEDDEDYLI